MPGPARPFARPATVSLIATMLLAAFALAFQATGHAQVERDGPTAKYTVVVNLCIAPGCTELPSAISPVDGIEVTVSDAATDEVFSSCVTGTGAPGTCTVDIRLVPTLAFSFDEGAFPAGYRLEVNPQVVENQAMEPGAHAELPVLLYPVNGFPQDAPAPTVAAPPETPDVIQPGGMPAGLYAGTCVEGNPGDLMAQLNGPAVPEGAQQGATDAIPVGTGYTVVDVSFQTMLSGGIVVAIFDEGNPETMIACGPVGGILDGNGALALGLAPVGDTGATGVAYLIAHQDATATGISLFLVQLPAIEPSVPAA